MHRSENNPRICEVFSESCFLVLHYVHLTKIERLNMSSKVSEVQELFERLQKETGGNIKWENLPPSQQITFTDAVRYILNVTAQYSN